MEKLIAVRSSPGGRLIFGLFPLVPILLVLFLDAPIACGEDSNVPCASLTKNEQVKTADASLDVGNNSYLSGDVQGAEKAWRAARSCSPEVPAWPKAVYNLGLLEMNQGNYPKAIGYFDEVVQSHPNDKEPGENIMQVYRNYSNRSVLRTSECYEKTHDYRRALRYAWLAKTRYPYVSWCGTCLQAANLASWRRLTRLAIRAYQLPVLGTFVVCVTFVFWKKNRIVRIH
jgi:outer membrane protein assembly factor BamD (BamD/ComL family)